MAICFSVGPLGFAGENLQIQEQLTTMEDQSSSIDGCQERHKLPSNYALHGAART